MTTATTTLPLIPTILEVPTVDGYLVDSVYGLAELADHWTRTGHNPRLALVVRTELDAQLTASATVDASEVATSITGQLQQAITCLANANWQYLHEVESASTQLAIARMIAAMTEDGCRPALGIQRYTLYALPAL